MENLGQKIVAVLLLLFIVFATIAGIAAGFDGWNPLETNESEPALEFIETEETTEYYEVCTDESCDICRPETTVVIEETTVEETTEVVEPLYDFSFTAKEMELIARVCFAEAGNQCELGKRMVIDTILNRLDDSRFPNTVEEVITAPGQYECVSNGAIWNYELSDEVIGLIFSELESRTDYNVIYFCSYPCNFSYWATYYTTVQDHMFFT